LLPPPKGAGFYGFDSDRLQPKSEYVYGRVSSHDPRIDHTESTS